jgi:hypothetical protein
VRPLLLLCQPRMLRPLNRQSSGTGQHSSGAGRFPMVPILRRSRWLSLSAMRPGTAGGYDPAVTTTNTTTTCSHQALPGLPPSGCVGYQPQRSPACKGGGCTRLTCGYPVRLPQRAALRCTEQPRRHVTSLRCFRRLPYGSARLPGVSDIASMLLCSALGAVALTSCSAVLVSL